MKRAVGIWILRKKIRSNKRQAGCFKLCLIENVDIIRAREGESGSVICSRFSTAGESIGKTVGRRAIAKCQDDNKNLKLKNQILEREHLD